MATTEPLWLSIPPGYAELPLDDIPEVIDAARQLIAEFGSPEQQSLLDPLSVLLEALAERQAVYCGIGRHQSAIDGQPITSSLVATVLDFPGERNPRFLLLDLLIGKARAHEKGQADIVDLPNGPAAFFERVLDLGAGMPVWQLEASVPSPAGDRLVTIEASTPYAEHGPQYRAMVVAMASGVSFAPPGEDDPLAILGG